MEQSPYALEPVLRAAARTIAACVGFGTAVINLHRPAWDDFQTVVVEGSDEARARLLGRTSMPADWEPLLHPRFARRGAYLIEEGQYDWTQEGVPTYIPETAPSADPDAWQPEDVLLVPLRSGAGELLGILSVDEPTDGRRPTDERLDLLVGVSQHAALALEHAQQAAAAERQRAAVDHLLSVTSQLTEGRAFDEMAEAVCVGIHEALGFQIVCVSMVDGDDFVPSATIGLGAGELAQIRRVPISSVDALFDPAMERDGVILVAGEEAAERIEPLLHSNVGRPAGGRGSRAWNRHVLIVPMRDRHGRLIGSVWADGPEDHLLPTREMLQALRAFANQAVSAMESARQLELMRHQAEHDPLTGLRNRRGLQEHIDAEIARAGSVALLVCDLDNFKRVNDVLGYVQGDDVLRRTAEVLARAGGLAARLGGEEFAVVLPGLGEREALEVGERLRAEVRRSFDDLPWSITTSVGAAVSGPGTETASTLLRAATRAVFGAKRLGRDRCVAYHAETLEPLLGTLEDAGGAAREQLAAAMLLAETLDLRDVGTARHSETVGRYAEAIARALGLPEARIERIRAAGVLHDIGKLGVADAVLKKPGPLTAEEWEDMRRHPELGARILDHANLRDISAWVLAHHERIDGRGYPHGLVGYAIPLEARILAVADAYEAMTADRAYRPALGHDAAQEELRAGAGTQFDPRVVDAFLGAIAPRRRQARRSLPARAA
jgi:diguanylate cyclase (GGDEF)-like protein/putative nucleotidyltransferase with HDIG domain